MRLLIVSDTHRDYNTLDKAILEQPRAEVVIHLGDGADDVDIVKAKYQDKMFIQVKGNCDFNSELPIYRNFIIENTKFFITHGHMYNAKFDINRMCMAARENNADILLFGHTHIPFETYEEKLHIMNPGSLTGIYGTYGIIDIEKNGIVKNIISINKTLWS